MLGIMGFSGGELLIVLAIILLLFGGSKLPSLAKGLGQSIKEFKKAAKDEESAPAKVEAKKPDADAPGAN
jgi:sec-independent protein translocase protein TatA